MTGEHTFANGRRYKVVDTQQPYKDGEYPSGGFHIAVWHKDNWSYIVNSPNEECVMNTLIAFERLPPEQYSTFRNPQAV